VNLEDLFREHERMVFAYFLRMVPTRHQAEDLTQETFTRACSAALRYRGDAKPSTWLLGIARRVLLEATRGGLFDRTSVPATEPARTEDHDERLDLERALRSLGLADREALLLVDVLDITPKDAASIAGISRDAFRVRLHRARARLREVYVIE
jgi:RNA polymerase sigma-70 factor (ECF subfamily)